MSRDAELRQKLHPIANHLIDEYQAGRLTRREFVRRLSVLGINLSFANFLASACGGGQNAASPTAAVPQTGSPAPQPTLNATPAGAGTPGSVPVVRAAVFMPAGKIDPITIADEGGLCLLSQTGEYLCWADEQLNLRPELATSWQPNDNASVWTFTLRQGVTFHNGKPLRAQDVVATFKRLTDPNSGSNALSAFQGVITPDGIKAKDEYTVVFELQRPFSNFPYLVSSDNYNTIILPEEYDGNYESTFIGTGALKLKEYQPRSKAVFVRNPTYWGKPAIPDMVELRFYEDESARILAFQGREVDVVTHVTASNGQPLFKDSTTQMIEFSSTTHLQVHMRTDTKPFDDRRVRQAIALLLDRPAIINGILLGKADIGNDHPFAPVYPSTDKTVAQRQQDLAKARSLLQAAGYGDGFSIKLVSWRGLAIPDLAAVIQQAAQQVRIRIDIELTDAGTYYGKAVFGESPWLDSTLGITDYGHRGAPDVVLRAALRSDGVWNAAHFKNTTYDRLVDDYAAATDLQRQRQIAKNIEELLLEETPLLITFFERYLIAARRGLSGIEPGAVGHLRLAHARFS
ncbi:ABC transporter substrate-binding protein [Thermorudis peleae]|uniref:ABC transporter substrate-binding protein n=1 Tax=Thermorudis peleae TaxID=1382356 RepID=UPI00056E6130|nr:ABC transporter substrate-binding protein [Thermorudis peleae]